MIYMLLVFFIIAIVGLLDLNKRVHELEEQQKQREELDDKIRDLIEDLALLRAKGRSILEGKNESVR